MPLSDRDLLDRYLARSDEAAFRLLVDRHLALVHGVALRVTGNEDLARDASQRTLIRLALQAARVPRDASLPAWLHRMARHQAIDLLRAEDRRRKRERHALFSSSAMGNPDPMNSWAALAPVLDDLVNRLPDADRDVLLRRYYGNESHAQIGRQLGLSEDAVRKRAARALEKLRALLGRKGIATTSIALATLLPAHAVPPVPVALASSIATAAQSIVPMIPHALPAAFAVMNTAQKLSVAAAAVFFLSSVAYSVRPVGNPSPASVRSVSSSPAAVTTVSRRQPREGNRLPETPEGRYQRLMEILEIRNGIERKRELIGFIDHLPRTLFPEIFDSLQRIDPKMNPGNWPRAMLFSAWVHVDPHAALATARRTNDFFLQQETLAAWATLDPESAIAWTDDHPKLLSGALAGMATLDLPGALKVLQGLPEERRGGTLDGMYQAMMDQPQALVRLVDALPAGPLRSGLLGRHAEFIATTDPRSVATLLKEDPEASKRCQISEVYDRWARLDAPAAGAALAELEPGADRREAVIAVARITAGKQIGAAFDLLEAYPEAATESTKVALIKNGFWNQTEGVFSYLPQIAAETLRNDTWIELLNSWRRRSDADKAEAWIAAHRDGLPAAVQEAMKLPPGAEPDPFAN